MSKLTYGDGIDVLCPNCGNGLMHHKAVDVFNRDSEDAETGIHAHVSGTAITADRNMLGNPSLRRQGVTIEFECECCNAELRLDIVQHKGVTGISWRHYE